MLTRAPALDLLAIAHRRHSRILARLAAIFSTARSLVGWRLGPAPGGERIRVEGRHVMPAIPLVSRAWNQQRFAAGRPIASISFVVCGTPQDRKAFITAIRAFALAGRLGDHLTLVSHGRHRRSLEKWSRALGIENAITFADRSETATYDVGILVSRQADLANVSIDVCIAKSGAYDNVQAAAAGTQVIASVGLGDVVALLHAILLARQAIAVAIEADWPVPLADVVSV